MLDRLRQGAQGWLSKLLMILLVVSFGIWGVAGEFSGYGAGTLATVGDQEVTVPQFASTLDRLQRTGRQVAPEQVLNGLLMEAALDDEAGAHNLGISDDAIARQVAADPRFHGQNGSFDRDIFNAVLQNSGIDPDEYLRSVKQDAVRNQISSSIGIGVDVPQPLVERSTVSRTRSARSLTSPLMLAQSSPSASLTLRRSKPISMPTRSGSARPNTASLAC
jgi:peptidyl-prolyl cis-trans isomerase D